jgi:4-amino-4-deoxy-L-arabinose transferase-like glycosyltransferase
MSSSAARRGLLLVVVGYVLIGAQYAARTPAWQAPDEPAHYNYIRLIVQERVLPVLQLGDYDAAYLDRLKAEHFPAGEPIDSIRYEGWQPPLYYLLAAPVFAATGGSLLAIRLFTLWLGAAVIILAWRLAREIFPASPGLALTAAGFVAFIPQHVAMTAAANNDALAEIWIGLGLWLAVRLMLRPPAGRWREGWLLGLVLGLAFLTKLSAYPLAGLVALALLLTAWRERWPLRWFFGLAAQVFVPALILGGLWWGRNLAVYGGLDFLAMQRHELIVVGQKRTVDALAEWGVSGYFQRFAQTTFQSFWGQFGWMGVVMDRRVYLALLIFSAGLLIGLVGVMSSIRRAGRRLDRVQTDVAVLLSTTVVLAVAVYLYYNLTFVQFQGRYLYPALPVLALAAALALRQWARWILSLLPVGRALALSDALAMAPIALMAALDIYALYRFIIPALTPPA